MSDKPITPATPPASPSPTSTQSLDEILNQLEKQTGTPPSVAPMAETTTTTTTQMEPKSVVETTTTETTAEPTPVATVTENQISPPPTSAPTEPAPMVKEEPTFASTPTSASTPMNEDITTRTPTTEAAATTPAFPEPAPTPETSVSSSAPSVIETTTTTTTTQVPTVEPPLVVETTTTETTAESPKKSGSTGKIIVGAIGVLLLAGAAGAGVLLTQQSQETRSPASTGTTITAPPLPTPVSTQIPSDIPSGKGKVIGRICLDKTKTPGVVYIYNLTTKTFTFQAVGEKQETFTALTTTGQNVLFYQADKSNVKIGYTNFVDCPTGTSTCTDHKLKPVNVIEKTSVGGVALCDDKVDATSVPGAGYDFAQ